MKPQGSGGGGWHVPPAQIPSQRDPQAPQFASSLARSAQTSPSGQSVVPAGHAQVPPLQMPCMEHAVSQLPQ